MKPIKYLTALKPSIALEVFQSRQLCGRTPPLGQTVLHDYRHSNSRRPPFHARGRLDRDRAKRLRTATAPRRLSVLHLGVASLRQRRARASALAAAGTSTAVVV